MYAGMMDDLIILAGSGDLPVNLIKTLKNKNCFTLIISNTNWSKKLEKGNYKIVSLGNILTELLKLKKMGYYNIIFAGGLERPSISEIKPDINTLKFISKFTKVLLKGGDNRLLTSVIFELERLKFKVLSIRDLLPELFLGNGVISKKKPCSISMKDLKRGEFILKTLSNLDIGQSLIIQQGNVLGIEAIEGTDALIMRVRKYIKEGVKPTLVKLLKDKQDLRADLPTIGLKTVNLCSKFGIAGIAFSSNKTIFLNNKKLITEINRKNLFLIGLK
tara:strand:- start:384 stop:1208 length:825 start_codon:yes stop_codon:yes gene_type:complete